jgi:hypothetical protein
MTGPDHNERGHAAAADPQLRRQVLYSVFLGASQSISRLATEGGYRLSSRGPPRPSPVRTRQSRIAGLVELDHRIHSHGEA